jgi:aspartate aminotransferase
VVYSFSKVFSVPGLRIGAVIAPRDVAREVAKFNRATVNVPPTPTQRAVASVVDILPRRRAEVSEAYRRRAELAAGWLKLEFVRPGGAFYVFPRVGDDVRCFKAALAAGVSLLPGSLYGDPHHVRLALVEDEERLKEAFTAVNAACGGPR